MLNKIDDAYFGSRNYLDSKHEFLHVAKPWDTKITNYILENGVNSLSLNHVDGWTDSDLDFLANVPHLKELQIISHELRDALGANNLKNLKYLSFSAGNTQKVIDFFSFKNLKQCYLEWVKGSESLFGCTSLEKLSLYAHKGKNFNEVYNLTNLDYFSITNTWSVKNLNGIERLPKLEYLRLRRLPKLESFDEISKLKSLKKLHLDTCRKIRNINFISELTELKCLSLNNLGEIESLRPLIQCQKLEYLDFTNNTKIVDGDLSIIQNLPNLKTVFFIEERHYSHKYKDLKIPQAKPFISPMIPPFYRD